MPDARHGRLGRDAGKFFIHGLMMLSLAGCATSAKQADGADGEVKPAASAKGILAKGGTAASNGYVDPALVSASSVAENAAPTGPGSAGGQPQPGFAEVVGQPTGIRAGSVSIFSGRPTSSPDPTATATIPTTAAPGRVNATAGSVFSTPAPTATPCGESADILPLSC